jgi:putative DNA primase/helicase
MRAIVDEDQRIEAALACIPADLPRAEWARIAAALKHELGDCGFDLFDAWSQRGQSYKAADARSTWRSLSASGGITIATLFHVHAARLRCARHGRGNGRSRCTCAPPCRA